MIGQLYREGELYTQETIEVFDHDWPTLATGVVIPHGLYDITDNVGYGGLAPATIPVNLPVTRFATGGTLMVKSAIMKQIQFCCYVMAAAAIALAITSLNRTYRR